VAVAELASLAGPDCPEDPEVVEVELVPEEAQLEELEIIHQLVHLKVILEVG
jgi:hypothetical protein